MIALVILLVGGLVAIGLWSWLVPRVGRHGAAGARSSRPQRRDPAGPLGRDSARVITERREALEAEDLAQMLAAHNAWRRRRGRPERTVEEVELMVARDAQDVQRRHEAALDERDLDELLEATNARRRARGLPERDRAEVRRRDGGDSWPAA